MFRVIRVLNNNAAVATQDRDELVIMGLAIGHGTKRGDVIPDERVERVFVPEPSQPAERLASFLAGLPIESLELADLVCEKARVRLGIAPSQTLVIALADHISFAARRQLEGLEIHYPLEWEITQLYPVHLEIGRLALELVHARTGIALPAGEAVAVAMHFVNAEVVNSSPLQSAAQRRRLLLIRQIFDTIDSSFDVEVDRESMSAARLVTHLRYVFARVDQKAQISNAPKQLIGTISDEMAQEVACARHIAYLLEMALDSGITEDEVAFIAIHVGRLVRDIEDRASAERGSQDHTHWNALLK